MEDIRLGRASASRFRGFGAVTTGQQLVPGDRFRTRLIFMPNPSATYHVYPAGQDSTLGVINVGTGVPPVIVRIEDYGRCVQDAWFVDTNVVAGIVIVEVSLIDDVAGR